MKVYRLTDRIPAKIGEITFWLSPLSAFQKLELIELARVTGGESQIDAMQLAAKTIKYSLKAIDGLECFDGSKYELAFDDAGNLTDDCVGEILLLQFSPKLTEVAAQLIHREIDELKAEGVEIDLSQTKSVKKK